MLIVAPHIRSAAGTKISLRNNVCRSLIDYVAIKINNKNCYYDPDVNASPVRFYYLFYNSFFEAKNASCCYFIRSN